MLVSQLLEDRDLLIRGLAHPVAFLGTQTNNLQGRTPGLGDDSRNPVNGDFQQWGAVMVTPRNYYRMLQSGQNALLFPGGAREALSGQPGYPLMWPNKLDFVRTAARFNATIVPLSAIGMLESLNVVAEPDQILNLPFIGERARAWSSNITAARYDEKNDEESLFFPIAIPKLPARNYFLFGRPIDTTSIDPQDLEACNRVYRQTQDAVRKGLDDLLQAADKDPYKDPVRRLAYERLFGRQAPTFSIDELN